MGKVSEKDRLVIENTIHLQNAASSLRQVLPGYGINKIELRAITKPLMEKVTQLLEAAASE